MAITDTTFSAYGGIATPAVSAAGTGRIYFDSTTNTFRISGNAGPYEDIATRAWVLAQMDYSTAITDPSAGFVANFTSSAPPGKRCVEIHYEIAGMFEAPAATLFLQFHDSAGIPAANAQALESYAVSGLDADNWQPPGTQIFTNGIFVGLSTTDRVWTASTDLYLYTVVRYLP